MVESTDSSGNYIFNLTAPSSYGTYEIKVNTTYNGEYGEQNLTLKVNYPPTITTPIISPASPTSSEDLKCNVTVTDLDDSSVSVEWAWYNGTTEVSSGTTNSVSVNTNVVIATLDSPTKERRGMDLHSKSF
jgi:hypothetical protein